MPLFPKPIIVAMDLEGCLFPEIWMHVAKRSGITNFQLTTRDIKNYNTLMRLRIQSARKNNITLAQIQKWISEIKPIDGAEDFINNLQARIPLLILSDTFYEFSQKLMPKLGNTTLLCHTLQTDVDGYISHYSLRKRNAKAHTVRAMQSNGFYVIAIGDSYNDIAMLKKAQHGFLLHAPKNIASEYPQFPSSNSYTQLQKKLDTILPVY